MSEDSEQAIEEQQSTVSTISHSRILFAMAFVSLLGVIAGTIFISANFGIGVFIGGILSLVNYFWLKQSLKKLFDSALNGEKSNFLALKYFLRYLLIGIVLTIVYLTKTVPIVSVLLGLASFALAIIIEAFIRLFSSVSNKKEI
ncbi:MAG TPA: ATP synthase subunit I [Pyrinomonadaceae bacterium]|nr:ATP synthase subunit I [Pyrinomonadaceae bacterium]